MPSRVNINIPPPLIEKAKVAQRANRQALDEKQRNASLRKKIAQRVIVESATSWSEKSRGGLLEFRQGHHWAVRSKRRLILNEPWLLVPDADYEGDVLKARTGPYHATSPANQRFLYIGQAIEARNVYSFPNSAGLENFSTLSATISGLSQVEVYTLEFLVRLGSGSYGTISRQEYLCPLNPPIPDLPPGSNPVVIADGSAYPVTQGPFSASYGFIHVLGVFHAKKGGGYEQLKDEWLISMGGQTLRVAGLGDGNFYHVAIQVKIQDNMLLKQYLFRGQVVAEETLPREALSESIGIFVEGGNYTTTRSPDFNNHRIPVNCFILKAYYPEGLPPFVLSDGIGPTYLSDPYFDSPGWIRSPSDQGLCAISGLRFTPDRALYPSTGFTPPTSITTFA